ncbi:PREDICTED: uncharacterized protein LOC104751571 isoform X2 [Camelina sativa]|uniref:Uncharacterized protein LOC104751571 isoform X2 n=1 Tax=Camelina sativa TaxID=90675 RepID=A0ABM0WJ69_CAMSA|nr:PREDICTED: uncharacterized protein LOC104751571 isoform X2 [Camelina sativa]
MEFHRMKRKRLQALSKKHGIPANIKNTEMARRLAYIFEKETFTELIVLPDDSDEVDVVKDDLVVKKVRFSPENEVFEFTRSMKGKDVRTRSEGIDNVGESGIELRRSTRILDKGKTVVSGGVTQEECKGTELMALEQFEYEADISESEQDGFMVEKVGRRSTRIASKAGTLLPANRSKLLVDIDDKEDQLVKNNVKELVSMVQDTGNCHHRKDVQDDPKFEKVPRRSRRIGRDIDVQANTLEDQRRSTRLKARSTVVTSQKSELATNQTKELSIDCEVQTTEDYRMMKVQDASKVEMVPRRSKRGCNEISVLMDKQPVKAVKLDHLGVKKAPNQFKQREKRLSKLLVDDGQAQKGDKQPKKTFGNGSEDKKLLRSLTHTTLANTLGQAMSSSTKPCSVIDSEKDGASVDNLKKSNVIDEMQMDDSFENPIVVEENLVEKKTGETLEKKRDRSRQGNQTPRKLLDQYAHFEQEEADKSNVGSRGSSKRSETMNQICVKEKPQGMIENSTFPSDTKAAESVLITENVLDSTPDKAVESSQRKNTQELNSELTEDKREERLERDSVLIAAVKENEKEVSSCSVLLSDRLSPASMQYSVSNSKAELFAPTGHIFVKENASIVVEENTKTMDEILICTPMSELKEQTCLEAILENSAECWKEIHPSKADEKISLEKDVQAANLHGNVLEYNTVGCLSAGPAIGSSNTMKTVNQELVKDTQQGMTEEHSPSTSETKAAEPVTISKNDLDFALKVSGHSLERCTQDLDSELLEGEHEQKTFLMAVTKKGKGEASSLSKFLVERSEVNTRPDIRSTGCYLSVEETTSPAKAHLRMSHPKAKLGVPTSRIFDKDIVSTVITEENIKTKEDTLICTPRSELKEHSSISKLAKIEAECCKETHLSKDDEKGMEDSLSTSETKAAVSVMISENVLETTLESSIDISQRRNTQELHSELMEGECEEKHEQDTVLMASTKEKVESSSLSLFLMERSEVNNPAVELFVETTQPPTSVLLAVSNPEAELGDPTDHILVKDIASTVIAKEDINTKDEIFISTPTCELKEHNFVAKLAEEKAILEYSSECQNEIQSGEDGETGSLKKTIQAENLYGNFSGYNTKNSSLGECVNLEMLDEILEKSEQKSYFERGCKLNALELKRCSSTDITSHSLEENNVSKCFEEDNTEALSLPLPRNNDSSSSDELAIFTTPERKLMLMERSSERGKMRAADSVTQHNDEAVESHAIVFTTPKQVSTLGNAEIDEAGKEDEAEVSTGLQNDQPLANFEPNETGWQGINSAEKSCLFTSAERQLLYGGSEQKEAVIIGEIVGEEFHDVYVIPNVPVKHTFPENSELDEAAEGDVNKSVKLRVDSGIFTSAEKHFETDEGVKGDNITAKSHVVSDLLTAAEGHFLLMGVSEPDEAEKSREKGMALAAESMTERNDEVGESHAVVFTTPKQVSTLGDAGIDEEHTSTIFPDEFDVKESIVLTSQVKQGDRSGMNEENRTVELQRDSGTCSLDAHTLLGNYVSGGGNNPMEFYEDYVVFTDQERYELAGSVGHDKARESEGKEVVQFYEKSEVSTGLHSAQPLAFSELSETGRQGINSSDKSGLFTSVERQLLYGASEQKEAVKTGEKAGAEYHDGFDVPENSELNEAAKGEENKYVEFRVASFTSAEKHLETDEGVKGDNITAMSHAVSDVLSAVEGQFLMGESEPDEAEKKYRENNDVDMLGESNTSFGPEMHMLFGESELDGTKNIRDYTATTCEESFAFTSPERRQLLVNFEPYSARKKEQKVVEDSVVQESLLAVQDFRENTIADSSSSIASKFVYINYSNAGIETAGAELMPKGSQAEDVAGHISHVDSLNLFDFETEEAESIMEAEINVSFSSYVALPAKGNSETIDEISHDLEVAGTCSMVSESGPSTDNQNQIHDALEELAITDINEADKLTKNIQKGLEGNFLLNSSGGSYVNVSGKTCILAGTEDEDEAAGPVATAFDKEMISREATPETRKEISEMQVRREPSLIYGTQVKPKRHDMKENAPNLKIVHNLNVTAPRTSKRQPLQDLGKN